MFLLWPHYLVRGGFAHSFRHRRTGDTMLCRGYPIRYALPRHSCRFAQWMRYNVSNPAESLLSSVPRILHLTQDRGSKLDDRLRLSCIQMTRAAHTRDFRSLIKLKFVCLFRQRIYEPRVLTSVRIQIPLPFFHAILVFSLPPLHVPVEFHRGSLWSVLHHLPLLGLNGLDACKKMAGLTVWKKSIFNWILYNNDLTLSKNSQECSLNIDRMCVS